VSGVADVHQREIAIHPCRSNTLSIVAPAGNVIRGVGR